MANLNGTTGNDNLAGSDSADVVFDGGAPGDDVINGAGGNDTITVTGGAD